MTGTLGRRLRPALLRGRRLGGLHGEGAPVPVRGDGHEFAELRAYVAGDDPRRIDWAATARAGEVQTRVVFEERALVLATAIETSRSMDVGRTRTNRDLAAEAAAVWFDAAAESDRCVRLGAAGRPGTGFRGRRGARLCMELREDPHASLAMLLATAHAALPRGSHLLVVSDFFDIDRDEAAVRACAGRGDVTALFARDPWLEDFPLGGFVRLRDAVTGSVARVFVDRGARMRYREASRRREAAVLERLRRCGARIGTLDDRGAEHGLGEAFDLLRPNPRV